MTQKIGFLFPGQGAQFVGMGKDLADSCPAAKRIYAQADEILGYSLSKICFEGPEEDLTRTLYAQPAIFVTSYAALTVLKERSPELKPAWVAGLSLGEFTALVAGGAMSFEDGLKLVAVRAQAMEDAASQQSGTMASVMGLAQDDCEKVAQEAGCQVANLNAPDQIVLSGSRESIDKACGLADGMGAKRVIPLKVGGAFHSKLMEPARQRLEQALRETSIQSPECGFVPNALGSPVSDTEEIRRLLAEQLTASVQWIKTMEQAAAESLDAFLEIGPGKVLKGLAKRCQGITNVSPCGTADDLEKVETLFKAEEMGSQGS